LLYVIDFYFIVSHVEVGTVMKQRDCERLETITIICDLVLHLDFDNYIAHCR